MNKLVNQHIERCIELWSDPSIDGAPKKVDRDTLEQMRSDLMILVGICMSLSAQEPPEKPRSGF